VIVDEGAGLRRRRIQLMMMPRTPFSWHHLDQWELNFLAIALMVGVAFVYQLAARKAAPWPASRVAWFMGALAVTFLATQSVIGAYDMEYFSAHMIEHLLLIMVAAPMFAASAPLDLARAAGPEWVSHLLDSRPARIVLHPIFGFALYAIYIPATHLSGFFNVMLQHEWVHHAEQLSFLVVGYLFWRHAFGVEHDCTLHPGLRLLYVMAAVPVDTITGLALAMSSHNPWPDFTMSPTGSAAASAIVDNIRLGGAIMWIGGDLLMLIMCVPVAVNWVRYESAHTRELDAQLDAAGL
jgi:putative copper resistance protein D